ncbi:LLM class flavin-dependent oxidoreductase [Amycolatopsis rubida]|uniref:Flavin-dependent oxidoreductase, luciferase family (Includes alkanesulfonate monooxygenase SsuD and methylene tetrahydromethanopterin reductase) n=1 Tax=Amycolatopsis rubida TaxID=112413 RepID=A0A1I5V5J5_9PSEU|nr:LLM class flavin-dependent oxidoreductase [Amycolatopsis rubida]SFQ02617.1 Flavin-dependent oxidoreductase, luciferase family (includes alkanesulfonate monooxygenase SsuD and methylene tetrahydromethanopterin reductase) [Amycolatopsis rubida]
MKFGLLLPHFGEHASRENVIEGAKLAERAGFDSVWVRDHLVFEPHGEMEKPNRTFYDALTVLTAVGAVTERLELGTGSLIPFRHPLVTALMAGTITQLVGPRLVLGFGAGTFDHEFEAIEWGGRDRVELVRSNAEILRRVFAENDVSYRDANFAFENVTIEPKPAGGAVPFWYCGATPRSARLAVEFCDGWMPGRISMDTLAKRVSTMDDLAAAAGRKRPTVAVIPPTSIERTREEALRQVNVPGLLAWANKAKFAVKPPSGRFETVEDLSGQLIAGTPGDAIAEIERFASVGVEHLVFDFRFKFDRWFEQIELLGGDVIGNFR